MTGKQLDNEFYDKKIKDLINKNSDKPYLEGFKNWAKPRRSRRTIYNYLLYVLHFLNYINKDIGEIELDDYARYADAQSNLSSSNQIAKYSAIKCFSKYLKASRKISYDFMEGAERPKFIETQETKEKRAKKRLTVKQMHQMFRNIEIGVGNERALWLQNDYRSRDMAIVMVFLTTGIRITALKNMNVSDIDFENNCIKVTDKGDKVNIHNIPEETKTVLRKWLLKREEILTKADKMDEQALFISNEKRRLSDTGIRSVVDKYSRSVTDSDEKITPHALRATFGTLLYDRTHDIELVRQQMNHESVATTQRYIRGNEEANRKRTADVMGSIVSSGKKRDTGSLFGEE